MNGVRGDVSAALMAQGTFPTSGLLETLGGTRRAGWCLCQVLWLKALAITQPSAEGNCLGTRWEMHKWMIMFILLLAGPAACSGNNRRNSDCEWPRETATSLDLHNSGQLQHLSNDALLAEDLAIRYADVHWGQRSGHFAGGDVYVAKRDACMAALFNAIAKNHEVTTQQVRDSLARRCLSFDVAVLLSFAALYWFVAGHVARRVCRRFPVRESPAATLSFTAVTSVAVSLAGALLGETWSFYAEGIRLGNQHLSYRAMRVPWVSHRMEFFLACVFLYWLAAALHCLIPRR